MTRAVGRAVAAGVLGATLGAAWLALFYAIEPVLRIDFLTDPPRLVSGVYPAERDPSATLTFAWTRDDAAVRLPGIDRRVDWILDVRVRGARADPRENPELVFLVDGVPVLTRHAETDFENVRVTVPANPARRRGVLLGIHVSRTFVPGPADPRPLGVMIDWIVLRPDGVVLAPPSAFAGASVAGAALGAAVAALGVTAGSAVGAAVLLSAGAAAVLARGFGPYTGFPATAARLAAWLALALTILAGAVQYWRGQPLRNTARFAAALTFGALFLKLLVLFHPDMPIGDTLFQAHRFQNVLAGNLYFTSIAPGNYQFPYAPGLYVFSALFHSLVRRDAGDMALLRIVVCCMEAIAGLSLYAAVNGARKDRLAAAIAVGVYQLVPLEFAVIRIGNLTNAFAQSLAVFALVAMAARGLRRERYLAVAGFVVLLAAAFMSHTGTFAILSVTCVFTAVLFLWRGGPALRSGAAAVAVAVVLAVAVSVAVYYGWFVETYRTEFARIGTETVSAAPAAGNRTIGARAAAVPYYVSVNFGWALVALTAWGAWRLFRVGSRERLTLTLAGWALSCLAFLVLGVVTPVDMRYYLAAIPAVAVAAAVGASAGWTAGGTSRIAAAALLAWGVLIGVQHWWTALP